MSLAIFNTQLKACYSGCSKFKLKTTCGSDSKFHVQNKVNFLHIVVDHIVCFRKESSQSVSRITVSMVGRRKLTDKQRWQAICQLDVGRRQIEVLANFGVSQRVVSCLYQRYQQTGEVAERRGRGCTEATSRANDRHVVMESLHSRTLSAPKLRQELRYTRDVNASVQTIHNRLNERGLSARRPVIATPLTRPNRRTREQWPRDHLGWTQRQWRTGLEVIKLEFILKLKIKRNNWLLADTCLQAANHSALF